MLLDTIAILIAILFIIPIIGTLQQYKKTHIRELLLFTAIFVLADIAAIADLCARNNNMGILLSPLIYWKISQLVVQTIFFLLGILSWRILYDKPERWQWFLLITLSAYYGGLQTLILITPELVFQSDGGVGGVLQIGGLTLLSPTFQLIIDLWQLVMALIFFLTCVRVYLAAETTQIRQSISLVLLATFILLLMTIYELFEAFFLPQLSGTIFLFIVLLIFTYQILFHPAFILLSPIQIENLLVVTSYGNPLLHVQMTKPDDQERESIVSALLAGMLSAMDTFFRTWSTKEGLQRIETKSQVLLVETRKFETRASSSECYLLFFLTVDRSTALIRSALIHFSYSFVQKYANLLHEERNFLDSEKYADPKLIEQTFPFLDPKKIRIIQTAKMEIKKSPDQ